MDGAGPPPPQMQPWRAAACPRAVRGLPPPPPPRARVPAAARVRRTLVVGVAEGRPNGWTCLHSCSAWLACLAANHHRRRRRRRLARAPTVPPSLPPPAPPAACRLRRPTLAQPRSLVVHARVRAAGVRRRRLPAGGARVGQGAARAGLAPRQGRAWSSSRCSPPTTRRRRHTSSTSCSHVESALPQNKLPLIYVIDSILHNGQRAPRPARARARARAPAPALGRARPAPPARAPSAAALRAPALPRESTLRPARKGFPSHSGHRGCLFLPDGADAPAARPHARLRLLTPGSLGCTWFWLGGLLGLVNALARCPRAAGLAPHRH